MCTVSIVPLANGFRTVCNRDELRTRPAAAPPVWRRAGRLRAIWPSDPESGGTWIGANSAGMAMVLLNRTARLARPVKPIKYPRSRGTLIPYLLRHDALSSLLEDIRATDADAFAPFTLLVLWRTGLLVVRNQASRIVVRSRELQGPQLFTSSSLGDHLVIGPRRRLFRRLVTQADSPLVGQRQFHRHRWPDRPEISVWMSRADARTFSRTTLDMRATTMELRYEAVDEPC